MAEESASASEKFDEKTLKKAEKCLSQCDSCVKGREKGEGFYYVITKLCRKLCGRCRAYEKVYGVPAHELPPGMDPKDIAGPEKAWHEKL